MRIKNKITKNNNNLLKTNNKTLHKNQNNNQNKSKIKIITNKKPNILNKSNLKTPSPLQLLCLKVTWTALSLNPLWATTPGRSCTRWRPTTRPSQPQSRRLRCGTSLMRSRSSILAIIVKKILRLRCRKVRGLGIIWGV